MKTFLACLVAALSLTMPRAFGAEDVAETAGPNLIANAGFEESGEGIACPFPKWAARQGKGRYAFDLVAGRSGKAARIAGTAADRGDIHTLEPMGARAGDTIRLRFWIRTVDATGGAYATIEDGDSTLLKVNIEHGQEWRQYEARATLPKTPGGGDDWHLSLWIYHFGTGEMLIDETSLCVVQPDLSAGALREVRRLRAALTTLQKAPAAKHKDELAAVMTKLDAQEKRLTSATAAPAADALAATRAEAIAAIGLAEGGDGSLGVSIASTLEQVFLDEPFIGSVQTPLSVTLARNEIEGLQIVVSAVAEVPEATVSVEGIAPASGVTADVRLVGYVDTTAGDRPYQSRKLGWWPDPLIPLDRPVKIAAHENQPFLIDVRAAADAKPQTLKASVVVSAGASKLRFPLAVEVLPLTLPTASRFHSWATGSQPETIARYYGGDDGERTYERFVVESCRQRLPTTAILNGWGWKTASVPKAGDGYDFARLDRWLDVFARHGLSRFPIASVPRFRKFGGGDYDDAFHAEFGNLVKAYVAHLAAKRLLANGVVYNIDEASNGLHEWDECKVIYDLAKRVAPDARVLQCLNEYQGIQALTGKADIWSLYYGQYEQAGGPQRQQAGDEIELAVCIWPSERPNMFVEYPLIDSRILPWIALRVGAKGFNYWELYDWGDNAGAWWDLQKGGRTSWKLKHPCGDGLLMYPGQKGEPLTSLRLEAFRDGVEDYEYLALLQERAAKDATAGELLQEALGKLVTGVTTYTDDVDALLDLRLRIARHLAQAAK